MSGRPPIGAVPTAHQLRSALRAAALVGLLPVAADQLHNSYRHSSHQGIYRHGDLLGGEEILVRAELLLRKEESLVPSEGLQDLASCGDEEGVQILLAILLERRTPLWLTGAATGDSVQEALIPDADLEALNQVLDPDAREALLLQLGRTFSDEERHRVGRIAEDFVASECQADLEGSGHHDLAKQVRRLSVHSDQLGYDITAPRIEGSARHIECKGSRKSGPTFHFFLSRNEAGRALVDPTWSIVACHVDTDDTCALLGWLPGSELDDLLPTDRGSSRWQSVEITLDEGVFRDGLPPA